MEVAAAPGDGRRRILLVEDDERLAALVLDYLSRNGLEVHCEPSGEDAVERTCALQPDLLVLDVMLPGKDGFSICRELRARGATIPIVILTARDEDFDRLAALLGDARFDVRILETPAGAKAAEASEHPQRRPTRDLTI